MDLALLLALLTSAPAFLPALPAAGDEREDEFRTRVEQLGWDLGEQRKVPGVAIAFVRNGKLSWVQGCGYADLESQREVTADTVFNIGSISKTVAAVGVMRLVERKELDLDVPIGPMVKRWTLPQSSFDPTQVTLRRLLSHTAGLSLHGYPGFPPDKALPTLEQSLSGDTNGAGDVHIELTPGTKWQYSGGGYTLAQLLLEERSGQGFAAYMQEHVFRPLHMEHTAYGWTPEILSASATPYDDAGKPLPRGGPCFPELAAAGLQTTAADLARFAIASMPLFQDKAARVLEPATLELMHTPAPASPQYGLGFQVQEAGSLRTVGHGGANDGWMARLSIAPEIGAAIVVLTNGSNGTDICAQIEKAWIAFLQSEPRAAAPASGQR